MDVLYRLNKSPHENKFTKLYELTLDESYIITGAEIIGTKYGLKLLVTLNDTYNVILPDRYLKALEKEDASVMIGLKLIYKGKDPFKENETVHVLEFKK